MSIRRAERAFPWLELLTWLLLVSLILQIWPFLFWGLLAAINVRNWSWTAIIGVNVVVVLALIFAKSFRDS